jgi:hypothetical protein
MSCKIIWYLLLLPSTYLVQIWTCLRPHEHNRYFEPLGRNAYQFFDHTQTALGAGDALTRLELQNGFLFFPLLDELQNCFFSGRPVESGTVLSRKCQIDFCRALRIYQVPGGGRTKCGRELEMLPRKHELVPRAGV